MTALSQGHCNSAGKRSLILRRAFRSKVRLERYPPPQARRLFMKTQIHLKKYGNSFFHVDQQHAIFFLVAGFVLAALVVLVLVSSAS
jgi:hypothetical protein